MLCPVGSPSSSTPTGDSSATNSGKFSANSNLYPGIFYKLEKEKRIVYEQIIGNNKDSIEKLPAVGK